MVFCHGSLSWLIHEVLDLKSCIKLPSLRKHICNACWQHSKFDFCYSLQENIGILLPILISLSLPPSLLHTHTHTHTHKHTHYSESSHIMLRQVFFTGNHKLMERTIPECPSEKKTCQGRVPEPWPPPPQCSSYPRQREAGQGSKCTEGGLGLMQARAKHRGMKRTAASSLFCNHSEELLQTRTRICSWLFDEKN